MTLLDEAPRYDKDRIEPCWSLIWLTSGIRKGFDVETLLAPSDRLPPSQSTHWLHEISDEKTCHYETSTALKYRFSIKTRA